MATQVLSLYRKVLRKHNIKLSGPMKQVDNIFFVISHNIQLGDSYVRSEFNAMVSSLKTRTAPENEALLLQYSKLHERVELNDIN
jgi:hypothetical protein